MTTNSKKTYRILPNVGENVEIEGTRVEFNDDTGRVKVYDGEDLVASIASGSFHIVQSA